MGNFRGTSRGAEASQARLYLRRGEWVPAGLWLPLQREGRRDRCPQKEGALVRL
jgi:hypothetical protein